MIRHASSTITAISLCCAPALAAESFDVFLSLRNDSASVLPAGEICGWVPRSLNATLNEWQVSTSRPIRQNSETYCIQHEAIGPFQSQQVAVRWVPLSPVADAADAPTTTYDLAPAPTARLLQLSESFAVYPRRERVGRIFNWMVDHIEFAGIRRGIDGAEHALQVGKGDCTEHMLLAGELLERNGITIRRVLGLAIPKDQHQVRAAALHNWIEYLDNGKWLIFDSSKALLGAPEAENYVALFFYQRGQQLLLAPFTTDEPRLKLFLQ